jgi:hypothetical protein
MRTPDDVIVFKNAVRLVECHGPYSFSGCM